MNFYCLRDPRDGRVYWVGRTWKKIEYRLSDHCGVGTKAGAREDWIRGLRAVGLRPTIHLLQIKTHWNEKERIAVQANRTEHRWMQRMLDAGEPLLNVIRPGYKFSAEHIAKKRASSLAYWADPANRAYQAALRRRYREADQRKAVRSATPLAAEPAAPAEAS